MIIDSINYGANPQEQRKTFSKFLNATAEKKRITSYPRLHTVPAITLNMAQPRENPAVAAFDQHFMQIGFGQQGQFLSHAQPAVGSASYERVGKSIFARHWKLHYVLNCPRGTDYFLYDSYVKQFRVSIVDRKTQQPLDFPGFSEPWSIEQVSVLYDEYVGLTEYKRNHVIDIVIPLMRTYTYASDNTFQSIEPFPLMVVQGVNSNDPRVAPYDNVPVEWLTPYVTGYSVMTYIDV